jgi:molybdenum cofactor synthesis domain-containing protein
LLEYIPRIFKLKIITLSDRAHAGTYSDRSGELIVNELEKWFTGNGLLSLIEKVILPDDKEVFKNELEKSVEEGCDVIFSTGSTGLGTRDIAPPIIHQFLDMELVGIMDLIRVKYGMDNPRALLSRSVAGVTGQTILFGLPGSTRAVSEYMNEITKLLRHAIYMIHDIDDH